jgi:exosortase A
MIEQTRSALSPTVSSALREWLLALGFLCITCTVFGILFQREIIGALQVWIDSTAYNHCFLVLPMAVVLLWVRRDVLARLAPNPTPWALLGVLALSALWVVAAFIDILEAEQLIVIGLFETLILAVIGWRTFRALMAPLLFLFFLVPFGAFLVPVLQQFTVVFAAAGLRLLSIPVFVDGTMIQIPEGVFEVAEACAGLRFLIASIVFGCFFATIVYRGLARRVAFIALATALPIVANGLRALGLILLAHIEGNAAAALVDHVLYGWIFFTLVTLLLIALGMGFAERHGASASPVVVLREYAGSSRNMASAATMVAGLLIVILGPAYLTTIEGAVAAPADQQILRPRSHTTWIHQPDAPLDWRPTASGARQESMRTYYNGDAAVSEFLAVYPLPRRGSPLTRGGNSVAAPNGWQIEGTDRAEVSIEGRRVTVNSVRISQDGRHRLVWWFYNVDGAVTGSTLMTRLLEARVAFQRGAHSGAVIAISTEANDLAVARNVLGRFLSAVGPVHGDLL